MSTRIEKNRRHLVTIALLLFAALFFLLLDRLDVIPGQTVVGGSIFFLAVLAARTAVTEIGIRRMATNFEEQLDRGAAAVMKKQFGIVAEKHVES